MLAVIAIVAAVAGGELAVTMNTTRPHVGQRTVVSLTGQVGNNGGHLYVFRNPRKRCSDSARGERRIGTRLAHWRITAPFEHRLRFTPHRVRTEWICAYLYVITCDAGGQNCAPATGLPPDAGFAQVRVRVLPASH